MRVQFFPGILYGPVAQLVEYTPDKRMVSSSNLLRPRVFQEKRDSNPYPLVLETTVLPLELFSFRPFRLGVRTSLFHGEDTGSSPVGDRSLLMYAKGSLYDCMLYC